MINPITIRGTMTDKSSFLDILREYWPFRGKADEITFKTNGELTLGAEIELQLIDPDTKSLISKASPLLKAGASLKKLQPEFYLSTVEIITDKCNNAQEIEKDLSGSLDTLNKLGAQVGINFATTGCHPFSRYADCQITPTERYNELIDRNQWLTRRMTVYGLHVHIGMASGDHCIRFNNFFLNFLPHLLALSASSPFWQGEDTGLASCRPTTYEALPTAGQPYQVRNWREFEVLYETLKKCKAIYSLKDLWWDMRPSPNYGTLEIRVCDGTATLAETVAIVAYIHLLAHWFRQNADWLNQVQPPARWVARENKWRVMRHGLEADLVKSLDGELQPIRQDIEEWIVKLTPLAEQLGYERYLETIKNICRYGNSSIRQRAVYERTQSLQEVVRFNTSEFLERSPNWNFYSKTQ